MQRVHKAATAQRQASQNVSCVFCLVKFMELASFHFGTITTGRIQGQGQV